MTLWLRIAAWAGLAVLLLGALHWWTGRIEQRGVDRGRAEVQALRDRDATARAQEDTARVRATLRQSEVARQEDDRREAAKQKEIDDAKKSASRAAADAARADRDADGLRQQLAAIAADARSRAGAAPDSCPGQRGPAAATQLAVLADVLGEVESAGRAMAAEADRRGIAGDACQRSYDSLTPPAGASP